MLNFHAKYTLRTLFVIEFCRHKNKLQFIRISFFYIYASSHSCHNLMFNYCFYFPRSHWHRNMHPDHSNSIHALFYCAIKLSNQCIASWRTSWKPTKFKVINLVYFCFYCHPPTLAFILTKKKVKCKHPPKWIYWLYR